ncbi:matrixin family metalloprotease [Lentilactobacillus sp. Marseille-Q4993]|uniref:matrixin family metalloprotease n=1 Tax=Lentilactobacillus sp. Marseille-Q4993 TaxID=3039492 RepID=UPI0024BCA980|nr:matrixin family metalloprotease [Lentilactobacillus sp. Marseille-Q4993]
MKFNKLLKTTILLTLSVSVFSVGVPPLFNSTKAATRIVNHTTIPTRQVKPTTTYLYRSTTLTKKLTFKSNRLDTRLYTNKKFTVKNNKQKTVTVYYIFNKNKSLTGYLPTSKLKITTTSKKKVTPSISRTKLNSEIKASPDLDPSDLLTSLTKNDYQVYRPTLNKAFNVYRLSPKGTFVGNTASVYVPSDSLKPIAKEAFEKWNSALASNVFTFGTKTHNTLSIRFANAASEQWDGMYNGHTVYIDQSRFDDSKYPTTYLNPKLASQFTNRQYWLGVITHELGHVLGLDHTGYQIDLMYSPTSSGNVIAKYQWKHPIQRSDTGLDGTEMATITEGDLSRAKLARNLGYW